MRVAVLFASAAMLAGCTVSPLEYQQSLSTVDEKWASPECGAARQKAAEYDAREKSNPGWGSGMLLGPYGLGIVAAIKENEQKLRRRHAREVHFACSSLPLPRELEEPPVT